MNRFTPLYGVLVRKSWQLGALRLKRKRIVLEQPFSTTNTLNRSGNWGYKGPNGHQRNCLSSPFSSGAGTQPIISLQDVRKTLPGGRVILDGVSVSLMEGSKVGVVGINGAGKSSFVKILAGTDSEFEGKVWRKPQLNILYLPQEPVLAPKSTVEDAVKKGISRQIALLSRFEEVSRAMGEPDPDWDALLKEQAELQDAIDLSNAWDLQYAVDAAMAALHIPSRETCVDNISGGERRRVALCSALLQCPDVLILDEPTNHLDNLAVDWLERHLANFKGSVVSVTHDRCFLENVAEWIIEVDRGVVYVSSGNYGNWLEAKASRLENEQSGEALVAKRLRKELHWLRSGSGATKARKNAVRELQDDSKARSSKLFALKRGEIAIPQGPRLGGFVLTVKNISKRIDGKLLLKDLSLELGPGEILGLIGDNGAGKTTLMNILAGEIEVDEGKVEWGPSVALGHVSQNRSELVSGETAFEAVAGKESLTYCPNPEVMPGLTVRAYLGTFGLKGKVQEKLVEYLSGGERGRVHLARILKGGCNVLLLDEPTNDLDVMTLNSLQAALQDFEGSAIIISHDRVFLDCLCDSVVVLDGKGGAYYHEGNFSHWKKQGGEKIVNASQ